MFQSVHRRVSSKFATRLATEFLKTEVLKYSREASEFTRRNISIYPAVNVRLETSNINYLTDLVLIFPKIKPNQSEKKSF